MTIKLAYLIDDEEVDQRQYQRVLKRSGVVEETRTFTYADDALTFLQDHPEEEVDVIFLDINMPRMNGFEFLSAANDRLGPNFTKIVVAMLTTSLDPADQAKAATFDVVRDFINKPLTIEHVLRVNELLEANA